MKSTLLLCTGLLMTSLLGITTWDSTNLSAADENKVKVIKIKTTVDTDKSKKTECEACKKSKDGKCEACQKKSSCCSKSKGCEKCKSCCAKCEKCKRCDGCKGKAEKCEKCKAKCKNCEACKACKKSCKKCQAKSSCCSKCKGCSKCKKKCSSCCSKTLTKPVENSMHEFMEYVFQPTYRRLKVSMASEPTDKKGWKAIKADSLILAESGNLIIIHKPKENVAKWNELSVAVRELGGEFYRSARKKDFKAATANYKAMLLKCNECHKVFDNGKHQLTP